MTKTVCVSRLSVCQYLSLSLCVSACCHLTHTHPCTRKHSPSDCVSNPLLTFGGKSLSIYINSSYQWLLLSVAAAISGCCCQWLLLSVAAAISGCCYQWLLLAVAAAFGWMLLSVAVSTCGHGSGVLLSLTFDWPLMPFHTKLDSRVPGGQEHICYSAVDVAC